MRLSQRGEAWSWRTWRQLRPRRPNRWTKLLWKGRKSSSKALKRQCRRCGALRTRHNYALLERGELKTKKRWIVWLFNLKQRRVFRSLYHKIIFFPGVSRVARKYTSIFIGEGEICPRNPHGRGIIVQYFIVSILQIRPINTCAINILDMRYEFCKHATKVLA